MPAIAKKGILYTETPSVENRVVEGNQNPVTSGAVYKEIGDTSVNNDLGANVSNQIENLHTQMQTKLTQEEFERRVHEKHPSLILLGKYQNSTEQIKCQCTTCGQIWGATPQSITTGKGCKKCWNKTMADKKRKPQEVFLEQVKQKHPRITILGKYENSHF